MFKDSSIYLCAYCGEKCTGKYCKSCGTQRTRKEVFDANTKIQEENEKKGFNNHKLKDWK